MGSIGIVNAQNSDVLIDENLSVNVAPENEVLNKYKKLLEREKGLNKRFWNSQATVKTLKTKIKHKDSEIQK